MAESVVSSGLGMLLTPSQGGLRTSSSLSNEELSAENSSSFSSVFESQTTTLQDTSVKQGEEVSVFADAVNGVEDMGLTLPQGGNTLPMNGNEIGTEIGNELLDDSGLEAANTSSAWGASGLPTESLSDMQDITAAFEADSIVGQILQSTLPTTELPEAVNPNISNQQSYSLSEAGSGDSHSSTGGLTGASATAANTLVAKEVATLTSQDSAVEPQDESVSAGISLISMMDRKSKVGEPLKTDKSGNDISSVNSSVSAVASERLLASNLQADTSSKLGEELDLGSQKTADIVSSFTAKSPNSLEIGGMGVWRQTSLDGYTTNAQPSVTLGNIDIPVGKAGWDSAVMEKVMFMSSQKLDSLEIALDPAELGPMHVRITANQEHTAVIFNAQSAQVREALDQASAQLRQQLESQGFGRVSVDVAGQDAQQNMGGGQDADGRNEFAGTQDDSSLPNSSAPMAAQAVKLGLVDTFV